MVLILYLATVSVDGIRKMMGLSAAVIGIIYVIAGVTYFVFAFRPRGQGARGPRHLPVWLVLLSLWCLAEAVSEHIPARTALIGWASYVFFVPLFYVGSELMADDRCVGKALRVTAVVGSLIGLGGIIGALMGPSAPVLLLPIIPAVGVHGFTGGNIYLSPSVFATAEEAAEHLLVALFAWAALSYLPSARLKAMPSAIVCASIAGGLIAAERRADIYVAVAGIVALVALGRISSRGAGRRASRFVSGMRSHFGAPLMFATLGAIAVLSILGGRELISFITATGSVDNKVGILFGVTKPALIGQGPGTSTEGNSLMGTAQSPLIVTNQGTYSGYFLNGRAFRTVEGGFNKTWLELGLVGVILYGGVFFSALAVPVRSLTRLDGVGRALLILTAALGIIFLKGHVSLDDPLVQPLFWLAAGGAWGRMSSVSSARCEDTKLHYQRDLLAAHSRRPLGLSPPHNSGSSTV